MQTWVAIASGPSLSQADIRTVQIARGEGRCKVAVINRTWELAPWADLLYASDARWWDSEFNPGARFNGEKHTLSASTARRLGIQGSQASASWSNDPARVFSGGLSGIQLINLLAHRADRVVLLGYDMQYQGARRHWHSDYDSARGFPNVPNLADQLRHFDEIARGCPIPILNATRQTALTQFPRVTLNQVLVDMYHE